MPQVVRGVSPAALFFYRRISFRVMKEKYTNGKANATEYNESRTAWMKAVSDRLQAKYDYLFRTKILDFYRGIPLTL